MARADWQLHQPPEELRRRYLAEGWWRDETFGRFLDDLLRANAAREVRIWSETHPHRGPVGDVHELARRLAGGLAARGFGPDDVIAFQLPNRVEALAVFYAVQLLGAVVVPIVHFYGPKEVGFILRQSGARAFVTADRFRATDFLATVETLPEQAPEVEAVVVLGSGPPAPSPSPTCGGRPARRPRRGRPRRCRRWWPTRAAPRPIPRASSTRTARSPSSRASWRATSRSGTAVPC